jgi:hypothetical protein
MFVLRERFPGWCDQLEVLGVELARSLDISIHQHAEAFAFGGPDQIRLLLGASDVPTRFV